MTEWLLWLGGPLLINLLAYIYRTNNRTTMRLKGMNLQPGSNFVNKNLKRAQLGGLDLSGCNFSGANLEFADLSGANLTGANFERCSFESTSLRNANCSKANLLQACVRWAAINGTNFDGATINGMKIFEDQIASAANLNANSLDVFNRSTGERINSSKQPLVQEKPGHVKASGKVGSEKTKPSSPQVTRATFAENTSEWFLNRVRNEVAKIILDIRLRRGSDFQIVFLSLAEQEEVLTSLREIAEKAQLRANYWVDRVRDDPSIADKYELINLIFVEFSKVPKVIAKES
jgi:hypothetical protein